VKAVPETKKKKKKNKGMVVPLEERGAKPVVVHAPGRNGKEGDGVRKSKGRKPTNRSMEGWKS